MQRNLLKVLNLLVFALLVASGARAEGVTVFAASSLRDAVENIAQQHETATGTTVTTVYAASSALARQIAQGAPADVVLLADRDWADWLVTQDAITKVQTFASNRLVLISGDGQVIDDITTLPQILGEQVLAMAQIEAVPAGRYGRAVLGELGLWGQLEARVVQAANVRAALRFVERGEAPFGIGYASDLTALPGLTESFRFDPATHRAIAYSGAAVTEAGRPFMARVMSMSGQGILSKWGFLPPAVTP